MELNIKGGSEKNPERAIVASTIIGYLSRDTSVKLDRLLKSNYVEVKSNPLVYDARIKVQLLSYFAENGPSILTDLIQYFNDKELYSAHLEVKNLLVVASKENMSQAALPLYGQELHLAGNLFNSGKASIISRHVKFAVACCILLGKLGDNFKEFMEGNTDMIKINPKLNDLIEESIVQLQKEIKQKIDESNPINK